MTHLIIGIILYTLGFLMMMGIFDNSTNHYSAEIYVNNKTSAILTFSTTNNQPLTIDLIKKKFDFSSNDKIIIVDIKSITRDEKLKRIEKIRSERQE